MLQQTSMKDPSLSRYAVIQLQRKRLHCHTAITFSLSGCIRQDIIRISHRDSVDDLIRKGRTLEKTALVTAVKAHIEDRIIVYNNKCVVFGD